MSTFVLSIDFDTFLRIVPSVIGEAKPILIRGKHGVGKSELVYQIGRTLNLPVVERRASQMTEGDLVGLPTIDNNRTRFNPPDWFKEACEKPVLLFLDEIDRATIEVRQGIFELTDSRKLNGHRLHEGTKIFAAVNGGKYSQQYQVGEMDPAELDRWSVFDVEPSVEDWLKWAKENVHPVVWDFVNQNHAHLEHKDEYEPNKKYPSRRSWKRCSDVLSAAKLLDEYHQDMIPLSYAFVGIEAATAFGEFFRNYQKQVVPDDIIRHGKFKLVKDFSINEHCALLDKIDNMGLLKEDLKPNEIQNLADYFVMLPSEAAMKLFKSIGKGANKDNNTNFYRSTVQVENEDGTKEKLKLGEYMVRLLSPDQAPTTAKKKK